MPRAEGTSRAQYVAAAVLDRAGEFGPVAGLRRRRRIRDAAEPDGPAPDGLPVPHASLRVLVGSPDADRWLYEGQLNAEAIARAVDLHGTVLDFGCGCGRTVRNWHDVPAHIHGCDVYEPLVAWCRENLPFMDARVNGPRPPAPYSDATFDVVSAISIVTHLTRERCEEWVAEWHRLLKPGGTLVVSTHGDHYRETLGRRDRPAYDAGEVVVKARRREGERECVTFHPPAYVRDVLLGGFDDVRHTPGGGEFPQDLWAAR